MRGLVLVVFAAAALLFQPVAWAAGRVAFVVGIDTYDNLGSQAQLQKARADARSVAEALRALGFKVAHHADVGRADFNRHWQDFVNQLQPGDTAAFYFAGHGIELSGRNYLLPRDIPSIRPGRDELLKREALSLQEFLADLKEKGTRLNLVVIDACRDNPFERAAGRSVGATRGLAVTEPPEGTFIMFSAATGESALDRLSDDDRDPNSVFTRQFLPLLAKPGLSLTDVAEEARIGVYRLAATVQHRQMPAYYNQVLGRVCLAGGTCQPGAQTGLTVPSPGEIVQGASDEASRMWQLIRETKSVEILEAFVTQFPKSALAASARERIAGLMREAADKTRIATAPTASECQRIPAKLSAPVSVRKGMRLCAEAGNDHVLIKNVTGKAVIYSVNGGYEISCSTTELCQFAWASAPLFNVRITDGAVAELIAPRR